MTFLRVSGLPRLRSRSILYLAGIANSADIQYLFSHFSFHLPLLLPVGQWSSSRGYDFEALREIKRLCSQGILKLKMQGNELSLAITLLVECTARRELSLQQRILTLSGFTQEFGFGSARLTSQHAKLFLSSTTRLKPAAVNPPSS